MDVTLFHTYTVHEYLLYWCVDIDIYLSSVIYFRLAFIVYRIFASIPPVGSLHKGNRALMAMLMAVVESGGLYASASVAVLATYLSNTNGQFVAFDVVPPLIVCYSPIIG